MNAEEKPNGFKNYLSKLFNYFLQGLIVLAPLGITLWVVLGLFNLVDNILPNIIQAIAPGVFQNDLSGTKNQFPGLGFLVVILLVLLVGWISSNFMVGRIVSFFEKILERTPGVKYIYSAVKDFLEAFAGNKKKFDKPVLVNIDATDVWRIGFITQQSASELGMDNHVSVYVPHSYAISGITYLVPIERIKRLGSHISAAEAMKFTVSGGVTELPETSISNK